MRHLPIYPLALILLAYTSAAAAQPVLADGGVTTMTAADGSVVAVGPDCADTVRDYNGQAGCSQHIRLSRPPCDPWHLVPTCDMGNPFARDLVIAPYRYGMALNYPGLFELDVSALSIHSNNAACFAPYGCTRAGQLWVGNEGDEGGLYLTAHHAADGAWVTLAADTFAHGSPVDTPSGIRWTVRDPAATVGVWSGAYGAEAEVASFDGAGALVCHGPVTTPALVLPGASGAVRLEGAPDGMGAILVLADGSRWAVQLGPVALP